MLPTLRLKTGRLDGKCASQVSYISFQLRSIHSDVQLASLQYYIVSYSIQKGFILCGFDPDLQSQLQISVSLGWGATGYCSSLSLQLVMA